jgi:hypothetical protein
MVRQDRLESLAKPETTTEELLGHRAVAGFIQEFLDEVHPQLIVASDMVQREQSGLPPVGYEEGDPYMTLSPDLDDLDNDPQSAVQ